MLDVHLLICSTLIFQNNLALMPIRGRGKRVGRIIRIQGVRNLSEMLKSYKALKVQR